MRLRNTEGLLSIYRSLAQLEPERLQAPRRPGMPAAEFLRDFYAANRPVILTGLMDAWPARSRWNLDNFKTRFPDEPAEVAERGPDAEPNGQRPQRRKVPFAQFADLLLNQLTKNSFGLAPPRFAEQPSVRQLLNDVNPWPEYLNPEAADRATSLVIEPAGCATPLRQELINVLVAQVAGQKRIKLIAPYDRDLVYCGGRVSGVNPYRPDFVKHPKFRQATVCEVSLQPGELLFLPVGWWHSEQTEEINITLILSNFVFPNQYGVNGSPAGKLGLSARKIHREETAQSNARH